jgi:hypothetical protein
MARLLSLMMIAGTSAWSTSAAAEALFAIRPHGGMNVALCGLSDICTAGTWNRGCRAPLQVRASAAFRKARALLGVKSHQKPGRRAGGRIWSLPDQVTSEAQPAAPGQAIRESRETHIAPKSKPISDDEWVIAVVFFRKLGVWPDHLGPPPGQSGCRAPLDVLQAYGFTKTGRRSA